MIYPVEISYTISWQDILNMIRYPFKISYTISCWDISLGYPENQYITCWDILMRYPISLFQDILVGYPIR